MRRGTVRETLMTAGILAVLAGALLFGWQFGTRLVREYGGVQHVVTVRADDFEYEGRPYRSLSAIARHITGTRWNGWVFFGLRQPGASA